MKYIYITVFFIAAFSLQAPAQNAGQDSVGLNRELTLEREYSPLLKDASKINQLPEIKEPEAPKSKATFSDYTIPLFVAPYLRTIDPNAFLKGLDASEHKGYLNLGLSSSLDIDGDLGYQFLNTNTDFLSLYASHRSSNSKVTYLQNDEKQTMKFNDDLLGANYKHNFERALFVADARYTYSGFNYYGFRDKTFDSNVKSQANNMLQTHLGVSSVNNEAIAYKINLAYTLFKQKESDFEIFKGRTENRIMADADFHANFNSTAGIGVGGYIKNYSYNVPSHPEIKNNLKKLLGNNNYTTLSANPYFTLEGDDWNVRLGMTANIQLREVKNFTVAPDIRLNWLPAEQFTLYLSAEGGIKDNSNYALFYENRYIDPTYRIYDSRSPFDGTIGFKVSPVPYFNFDLFAGYKWVWDEHFYLNKGVEEIYIQNASMPISMDYKIRPQYADAQTLKLGGSLKYVYRDIVDFSLSGTYYKWEIEKLSDISGRYVDASGIDFTDGVTLGAWNKPSFIGNLNLGFKIPGIPFRADLAYHLETGRKYLGGWWNGEKEAMKDIHDLSLKGTYSIDPMLSVYLIADNLLFQKYDIWYGYPARNFNIMGGISIKF